MKMPNWIGLVACCMACVSPCEAQAPVALRIDNEYVQCAIGANGRLLHFIDRRNGEDYSQQSPVASINKNGKVHVASAASFRDGRLSLRFGASGVSAVCRVHERERYFTWEVESVSDPTIERFTFVRFLLKNPPKDTFACCALALNMKTMVHGLPSPMSKLLAYCYPRTGLAGAEVAVVACPQNERREVMQEVIMNAPALPKSAIGGPWAWDAPINRGSYLFAGRSVSEDTVDDYIHLARRLGITQLNLHAARYGDWQPYPNVYPRGRASLKAVIDKIHTAGMVAGLHTYSFFISKQAPYVTPVPDPRLGKDATFTLAQAIDAKATTVPVVESTEEMSATVGFFVRNSNTVQIGNELIEYRGVSNEPPYAFTGCKRGACGTRISTHGKDSKVHHLRQCFWLFCPDGDSTLYTEVAANLAGLCNEVGFDMMYLDALDGGDVLAGRKWAWHYQAKFVFELWKHLKKPLLLEMSTFPHHMWYVRSRAGAWDHPNRSHKAFIDIHVRGNKRHHDMFLPAHLGWWRFKTWRGAQGEPTFPDDIEYLCAKCLGTGDGLSIQGITPKTVTSIPALPRLAAITRQYESLRHANYFTEAVKEQLRAPGEQFTLQQNPKGEWQFRRVQHAKHRVEGLDGWSNAWTVNNRFKQQPIQLRIEALMSVASYDDPRGVIVGELDEPDEFPDRTAKVSWSPRGREPLKGVTIDLGPSTEQVKAAAHSGRLVASNARATSRGSWAVVRKTFDPPANFSSRPALGLWVYGDAKGEVLNIQRTSPSHLSRAYDDHYIIVDFKGWRYFELLEPEGERHAHYLWPYRSMYHIYRESIRYPKVETLSLYCNNLSPKDTVTCYLSPIKALPTVNAKLRNLSVTVNGKRITFPIETAAGDYLEFRSMTDCRLYDPRGQLISRVEPLGKVPIIQPGDNQIEFQCQCSAKANPRAYVSVIARGDIVSGRNSDEKIKWEFLDREDEPPRVVSALDGVQNVWDVVCRPTPRPVRLDVEIAVEKVGKPGAAYDSATAVSLETFDDLSGFADSPTNKYARYVVSGNRRGYPAAVGVTHELSVSTEIVKVGKSSARYSATSKRGGGWSARGKRFSPAADLSPYTHVGFWLHGDGKGEILYLQFRDVAGAHFDMKTRIDFPGWKLVEFPLTRDAINLSRVEYLIIYYNAIPANATVTCHVDDIRALKVQRCLTKPTLTVSGRRLVFPISLAEGDRLLYRQGRECEVFRVGGAAPVEIESSGETPVLRPGPNRVVFGLDGPQPSASQVRVQVSKAYE